MNEKISLDLLGQASKVAVISATSGGNLEDDAEDPESDSRLASAFNFSAETTPRARGA